MLRDSLLSPFVLLCDLGLIAPAERDAALAAAVQAELPQAGHAALLAWMVAHDIVSADALQDRATALPDGFSGVELQQRQTLLAEAQRHVRLATQQANLAAVDGLLAQRLVSRQLHDVVRQRLPSDGRFSSPGAALAWLVVEGLMSDAEFGLLKHQLAAQGASAAKSARNAVLDDADAMLHQVGRAVPAAAGPSQRRRWLPGTPGTWLAVLALVLLLVTAGGFGGFSLSRGAVPACDASATTQTLEALLGKATGAPPPTLQDVKQVGYAKVDQTRGCVGTVVHGGLRIPYAFTLAPVIGEVDQFAVVGANPALVQARFGQLDAEGSYAHRAEPIGRDNLEQAVRVAVEAIGERNGNVLAVRLTDAVAERAAALSALTQVDPGRAREIAEVEPLAPCRPAGPISGIGGIGGGTRTTCRLLIERNDTILAAIGRPASMLLDADFTFERDETGPGWRTAPEFAAQFAQAVLQGRAALLHDAARGK